MLLQAFLHFLCFTLAEEPSVHQERAEALSNRSMQKSCCDARVNATADSTDAVLLSEPCHNGVSLGPCEVVHCPLTLAATNVLHEVLDQLPAAGSVCDFRVELDTPDLALDVLYSREFAAGRVSNLFEPSWKLRHLVAMAHPHIHQTGCVAFKLVEELAVCHFDFCMPKLPLGARLDGATQMRTHLLQAIANAQEWQMLLLDELPNLLLQVWPIRVIHGMWSSTEDNSCWFESHHFLGLDETRAELTIHVRFADTAANQVAHL
mmetsp:Transcript_39519/g.88479  ORF Transcript_39519/g.88479 Transcript_39519/m.88479 type:complete len:263 (+) Transcript_39519:904-1692(+)